MSRNFRDSFGTLSKDTFRPFKESWWKFTLSFDGTIPDTPELAKTSSGVSDDQANPFIRKQSSGVIQYDSGEFIMEIEDEE